MLAHALYSRRRWLTKIHPPEKKPSALGRGQVNHAEVLLRLVLHRRCPESKIDPSISLQKAILARSPPLCACMWRGLQRAFLAPFSSCFLSECQEVRQKSLGMQNYDFINSRVSTTITSFIQLIHFIWLLSINVSKLNLYLTSSSAILTLISKVLKVPWETMTSLIQGYLYVTSFIQLIF